MAVRNISKIITNKIDEPLNHMFTSLNNSITWKEIWGD